MAPPRVPDGILRETVAIYTANGENQMAAAAAIGITRSALQNRLMRAAERGFMGTRAVLPGFGIKQTSEQLGPDGELQRQWVKQVRDSGEPFAVPDGHVVKGVSALTDAGGNVIQQWVKTRVDDSAVALNAIKEVFDGYTAPIILPEPTDNKPDILTVYPIADLHLGMYAWAQEAGADYDLDTAAELLQSSMCDLVMRSAPSETAIVLDLGDYFHADNSQNRTARSGNALDVDTRYAKVVRVGVELVVHCIELALQKHRRVIYRKLPGNHDDETSLMLAVALSAWFRNHDRVTIDTNPSRFFMYRHGQCLIAATHGDMLKMADMGGYMAAQWPKDWGETVYRYAYTGHVHSERVRSAPGVRLESFNTIAAKDAWNAGMGFTSPRNMVAITLDKVRGETGRLTVAVPR